MFDVPRGQLWSHLCPGGKHINKNNNKKTTASHKSCNYHIIFDTLYWNSHNCFCFVILNGKHLQCSGRPDCTAANQLIGNLLEKVFFFYFSVAKDKARKRIASSCIVLLARDRTNANFWYLTNQIAVPSIVNLSACVDTSWGQFPVQHCKYHLPLYVYKCTMQYRVTFCERKYVTEDTKN